jgi:hypothetical protein
MNMVLSSGGPVDGIPCELRVVLEEIQPLRQRLLEHRVYHKLSGIDDLCRFAEYHVYAVWDFMSLLKALQQRLTCITVPWVPVSDSAVCGLVNDIVAGEESDRDPEGVRCSHFELYVSSMRRLGACTTGIETLVAALQAGKTLEEAFGVASVPEPARRFVRKTFAVLERGRAHEIAAAFTFGREDLLPGVFKVLVDRLDAVDPQRTGWYRFYLERHIQLDGQEHGEMGLRMVSSLCGAVPQRWKEVGDAASGALEARLELWDAIGDMIGAAKDS